MGLEPETAAFAAGPPLRPTRDVSAQHPAAARADNSADPSVAPAVEMLDIVKVYGANAANDGVRFVLNRGEIHALLGENGAGKTTLMSILYGMSRPDSGEIRVNGQPREIPSPQQALALGIGMVHQTFMLVPTFTVAEAVVLGTGGRGMRFRRADAEARVAACAERYGIAVDPRATVDDLPVDSKQRVEILKLLYRGARTLILDEPTSVLGPVESAALFDTLDALRAGGASIVIVTHKLREVMAMADRVTVLRRGRNVIDAVRGEYDAESLARAMVAEDVRSLPARAEADTGGHARPRLEVRGLTVHSPPGVPAVDDISFEVRAGEVLGVAGVAGNGQQELLRALAGTLPATSGTFAIDGVDATNFDTRRLRRHGVAAIPDDRQAWGIAPSMTVAENLALTRVGSRQTGHKRTFDITRRRARTAELIAEFEIRPANPNLPISALSGGNQQKVVLARELERDPGVVLVANPTQGLDVGATALVHRKLLEARNRGAAVLLVSGDIDELTTVSDRLVVLYRGRVALETDVHDADTGRIARAMAGTHVETAAATDAPAAPAAPEPDSAARTP
jgi:general nucleoside transport system ATP-binding protein